MKKMTEHQLRHAKRTDGRWVPACTCGWWSTDGSHMAFERHVRKQENPDNQQGATHE